MKPSSIFEDKVVSNLKHHSNFSKISTARLRSTRKTQKFPQRTTEQIISKSFFFTNSLLSTLGTKLKAYLYFKELVTSSILKSTNKILSHRCKKKL